MDNVFSSENERAYLGFETAGLYWRAVHEGQLPAPVPLELDRIPPSCITGYRALSHIDLSPLGMTLHPDGVALPAGVIRPIHLLADRQAKRGVRKGVDAHLLSGRLPARSLYAVSDSIAVTSPELTIAHLSRSTRVLPCIELGCEWCGSYAIRPTETSCAFDRSPIVDTNRLQDFLADPHVPRNIASLRKALAHLTDGLASPRETETYLMLTLPAESGGYAFPHPFVNQQIPLLGTKCSLLTDHTYYLADFLWPDRMLIGEYDGIDVHEATPQQVAADKERRNLLALMGYTVVTITKRDLTSLETWERKARQIALALGRELPEPSEEELSARLTLFRWLFDPAHDHLPFGFGYQ